MKSSQLILLLILYIIPNSTVAQSNEEKDIELDLQDEVSDQGTWTDACLNMKQRRYKINLISEVELLDIPFLSNQNAMDLYAHIQLYGPIEHLQEMQVIEHFDLNLIRQITPFIDLQIPLKNTYEALRRERLEKTLYIQNSMRIERPEAYRLADDNPNKYLGNPIKSSLRFQFKKSNRFNFGITYKKDAGELLTEGHNSGYLQLKLNRLIDQIVLGDYTCLFGQGMLIGTGLSVNKSATVGQSIKVSKGFNPLHSGAEYNYFRGIGMQLKHKNYNGFIMASFNNQDLKMNSDSALRIQTPSGYYRNNNELKLRNKAFSVHYLSRLEKTLNKLRAGISISSENRLPKKSYSNTVNKEHVFKLSFDYIYIGKGFTLFGESLSSNRKIGSINGLVLNLNSLADIQLNYRFYQKDINLNNSTALMESGNGENGLFVAYNHKTSRHSNLSTYFDFYSLNNYSSQIDAPTMNKEVRIEYMYEKRNGPKFTIRYSQKDKSKNESGTQTINRIDPIARYSLRLHLEYPLGRHIKFYHRIEQSVNSPRLGHRSSGYLSYHEMKIKINDKLQFYSRYCGFETNSYDSRIYVYEHDISYTYTNRAYYGKGNAFYLLLHYHMNKNLKFKLRFAALKQENQETIGSGLDTINGNRIHDVRMEVEFKI